MLYELYSQPSLCLYRPQYNQQDCPGNPEEDSLGAQKGTSMEESLSLFKETEDEAAISEEDYSDVDDEGEEGYRVGGYHRTQVGDIFNERYRVRKKLGWGEFSLFFSRPDVMMYIPSHTCIYFDFLMFLFDYCGTQDILVPFGWLKICMQQSARIPAHFWR